tara:strand:+ start:705 stop:908 length:204 start_codon:yes stop_codon:yes gene_type:complete
MKLNKKQTKELSDKGYDVVDKERIIHVYPSDGIIYGELIKEFGLTADEEFDCATLVVIATKETKPDE